MNDLVIKDARVVDGTGAAPYHADVAVDGDRITAVGDVGPGRRTIHADGALLTPGFVDIHTHYDGQATVPAGRQVLLMYGSANRDESVFDRPGEFDVTRAPGGHLAFGLGAHFCLGASLARLELRIFFEEFVARVESAAWADERGPRILRNAFVRGVTGFPISLTPRSGR